MKVCSKCKVGKDFGEFSKSKRERDGLQFQCKECIRKYRQENRERLREYKQKYRQENRESRRVYDRKYYQENRERLRERRRVYNRKYYQENRERLRERRREYKRKYYQENRERLREYRRKYYQENPEYFRKYYQENWERIRKYHQENREIYREIGARRRARKVNATVERFTHDELVEYWVSRRINPNLCWYCEEQPFEHVDHMTPLSRGGYHARFNLIPACGPCNISKHTKTVEEFIDYLEAQQRDEAA